MPKNFKEVLEAMPSIESVQAIELFHAKEKTPYAVIPNAPGKQGSLKIYLGLYEKFGQQLDSVSAEQGLLWFAEHTADARAKPGAHPNIDRLFEVIAQNRTDAIKIIPFAHPA
jgi:hypothetical protein